MFYQGTRSADRVLGSGGACLPLKAALGWATARAPHGRHRAGPGHQPCPWPRMDSSVKWWRPQQQNLASVPTRCPHPSPTAQTDRRQPRAGGGPHEVQTRAVNCWHTGVRLNPEPLTGAQTAGTAFQHRRPSQMQRFTGTGVQFTVVCSETQTDQEFHGGRATEAPAPGGQQVGFLQEGSRAPPAVPPFESGTCVSSMNIRSQSWSWPL